MTKKFDTSNLSKEELAKQLRKPEGTNGQEVGRQMNNGNKHICLNSYKLLEPLSNSSVLEIGMGNGIYIKYLLSLAKDITYTGLDFSQTMIDEATSINQKFININKVSFVNGSIEKLPFENESFDFITTTNTVYFWPNLPENMNELYRVLKPNGKLLIGYRSKELMDKIEFTNYGFMKYMNSEIEQSLADSGFKEVKTQILAEPDLEFEDKSMKMNGLYSIGIKPNKK